MDDIAYELMFSVRTHGLDGTISRQQQSVLVPPIDDQEDLTALWVAVQRLTSPLITQAKEHRYQLEVSNTKQAGKIRSGDHDVPA